MNRRVLTSLAVLAVTLTAGLAPAASANGLFGVIVQTPLHDGDVAPLREANPDSVRSLFFWENVQATKGPCHANSNFSPGTGPTANNCDWSSLDQTVRAAAQAGVKSFPFLFGSPKWLSAADKATPAHPYVPPVYNSADRTAWSNFVRAAVERYGRGGVFWNEFPGTARPVTDWQIWNEPTSPAYFAPRPNVAKYVSLVRLSNTVINKADPKAKVVLAGVFGTPRSAGGGIDMPTFFERLYDVPGVARFFDAAAIHPYSPGLRGVRLQVETARRLMSEGGDASAQLWISEVGWASDGPKGHTLTSTRRGQARLLTATFNMLKQNRTRWHLAGVNWFSWRDAPEDQSSCAACPWAGLIELDDTKKPAFNAFKKFS